MIQKVLSYAFIGVIALGIEFYVYQAVKNVFDNRKIRLLYWIFSIASYLLFFFLIQNYQRGHHPKNFNWIGVLFTVVIVPKIVVALLLFATDVFRFIEFILRKITTEETTYPSRRKFLSTVVIAAGGLLSYGFLDGIFWGKYRHFVRKVRLKIKGLPSSFKGYKIVQISDVHSGSFAHPEKLQNAINLINEQNPDLVLFTGDMVNAYAEEFAPFVDLFATIKSKDGKLAILGNHDYGTYGHYKNKKEAAENLPSLIALENRAGFDVLRNEHRIIEKEGAQLYIIGVENWGLPPFPQEGDLDKATAGIPAEAAKILMSHDPTHFDEVVKHHPSQVQLTLSGHTHGMQFGLDLKNIKWSPIKYKYPKWIDLYESEGKYLYVNRGFGVLGYPGRVGVKPEITLFELS